MLRINVYNGIRTKSDTLCRYGVHMRCTIYYYSLAVLREHSGSVVECLTRDRGATGSSLTGVTALCP